MINVIMTGGGGHMNMNVSQMSCIYCSWSRGHENYEERGVKTYCMIGEKKNFVNHIFYRLNLRHAICQNDCRHSQPHTEGNSCTAAK